MNLLEEFSGGIRDFCVWKNGKRGFRVQVKNKKEVLELLDRYAGLENCGISITTWIDKIPHMIYLSFDFDSDSLRKPFEEAKTLYNYFVKGGYKSSFHFSGRKGFHVIVKTPTKFYSKNQVESICNLFKDLFQFETIDTKLFGDLSRIIRLPGTYNLNGNLCKIIKESDGELFDIEEHVNEDRHSYLNFEEYDDFPKTSTLPEYPCVNKFIAGDEPPDKIRFAWVIERLEEGIPEEKILDTIRGFEWDDFDEDHTLYQIRHIRDGYYAHPSCRRFQSLGLCLREKCPYYKSWESKKIE